MFQYIRPEKVLQGLHWLQLHNELYQTKDIHENPDWNSLCVEEDTDMWWELIEKHTPQADVDNECLSDSETMPSSHTTVVGEPTEIEVPQTVSDKTFQNNTQQIMDHCTEHGR